jgi:O-antigen/teichoic acid export membrane protein
VSLKKQTLSGLVWTFADIVFLKGSAFIAQLILARLLGPEEFGLIGMITVFVAIGTSLVDSGLSASIIRAKNADDKDYSTVFYTNFIISIIVYFIIFLIAPVIANFYSQPILVSIIRVYCLSFIISSFSSIQIAILIKNMHFKKIMLLSIPGTLISITIALILSIKGFGVWSIVWMYLATQVSQSIMLWIFSKWKPSLNFSIEKLKYHFHFGYKLMLSGLLNTVFDNIYNILIGRFYSVKTLGYFDRAYIFNQYPVIVISGIISKVTYPMLANIQDEKERIASVYKKILQITFFITAPLMLGAAAIAKPLFLLVLGENWSSAVLFFQILCLATIFYPIHVFNLNILKVYGRSDLFLKLEIIKKAVVSIGILIAFQFGIYGLVWSNVITSLIALLINTHYSKPMISYSIKQQLLDMLPTFLSASATGLIMFGILFIFSSSSLLIQIALSGFSGCIIYILINYLFKTDSYRNVYALITVRKL